MSKEFKAADKAQEVKAADKAQEVKAADKAQKVKAADRGHEFKSVNGFRWVWYIRYIETGALEYVSDKVNQWELQDDIVEMINRVVKQGALGRYGVKFEYVMKCQEGARIKGDKAAIIGETYRAGDSWECKRDSGLCIKFEWLKEPMSDKPADKNKRIKLVME